MSEMQIQSVLQQMRALSQASRTAETAPVSQVADVTGVKSDEPPDFSARLKEAIGEVNYLQKDARSLQDRFELGDDQVSLPQVMLAMNKSSIAFEATNQVRNRLLTAYQEVMRMQV